MERILDLITKGLWNKNYPRTLIIFNVNNVGQVIAGIAVLIMSYVFPTEGNIGHIASALIILVPILGTTFAVINQEIYEWIVFITHAINAFIVIPLYFCTMGTVYGLGLVMMVLTVIQSYVLIKNLTISIITIALQNTFYAALIIMAFYAPRFFINFETLKVQSPLFYIGIIMCSAYISFLSRVFVYVFKLDYEHTVELSKNLETVNSMDDLTGAYNEENGKNILQTIMNDAWKTKDTFCIALVEIDPNLSENEENKYLEDLIIVNAFDACRDIVPSESVISRIEDKKFLLVLPNCKTAAEAEMLFDEIASQFSLLKTAAHIENGKLSYGCASLLYGMTLNDFISLAEVNLNARRSRV